MTGTDFPLSAHQRHRVLASEKQEKCLTDDIYEMMRVLHG